MDVSSVAAAMAGAQVGRAQLAMAAKIMKMNADSAASIIQVIEAAQQNLDRLADAAAGPRAEHRHLGRDRRPDEQLPDDRHPRFARRRLRDSARRARRAARQHSGGEGGIRHSGQSPSARRYSALSIVLFTPSFYTGAAHRRIAGLQGHRGGGARREEPPQAASPQAAVAQAAGGSCVALRRQERGRGGKNRRRSCAHERAAACARRFATGTSGARRQEAKLALFPQRGARTLLLGQPMARKATRRYHQLFQGHRIHQQRRSSWPPKMKGPLRAPRQRATRRRPRADAGPARGRGDRRADARRLS